MTDQLRGSADAGGLRQASGAPVRLDLTRSRGRWGSATTDPLAGKTARLDSLTGLRFLAAMLVVVHHSVSNPVHTNGIATLGVVEPLATIGYTGVTFFFALSGFVLAWSWRPGRGPREFWVRRFARVYPMHLVTWLVAIAFAIWVGDNIKPLSAVLGGVLLQAWTPDSTVTFAFNAPSWSLSDEAFFYALFPLLIIPLVRLSVRGLGLVALGAFVLLAGVPIAIWIAFGRDAVAILYYFPAYRVLEFVIGICLALAMRRGWRPALPAWTGLIVVVIGFVLTIVLGALYAAHVPHSTALPRPAAALVMAPFYVALIAIAAKGDITGRRSFFSRPFMVRLGTWSFAAYMTHLLLLQLVERLAGDRLPVSGPVLNALVVLIVLVGATLVSGLAYTVVEHPLERLVRVRLLRTSKAAKVPLVLPGASDAEELHRPRRRSGRAIALVVSVVVVVVAVVATALVLRPWQATEAAPKHVVASTSPAVVVPVVSVIGDGFSVAGATRWPAEVATTLHARAQTLGGVGTRLEQPAGASYTALAARVDPAAAAVVVMVSRADAALPTLSLVRSTSVTLAAANRTAPGARLLLVGPVWTTSDAGSTVTRVRAALKGAAASAGVTWVDPADGWYPSGRVPNTQADSAATESVVAERLAGVLRTTVEEHR